MIRSEVTIHPYLTHGMWVFDDATVGLVKEPLVDGADDLCDRICERWHLIPSRGFSISASAIPFVDGDGELTFICQRNDGYTYICDGELVWLCGNLLKYFPIPPRTIYFKVAEAAAVRGARAFCLTKGFYLVYDQNPYLELLNDNLVEHCLDGLEVFASGTPNIDWMNYSLVNIGGIQHLIGS